MTTDRDVRFSRYQLHIIDLALRDEIAKRKRSIHKAEANKAAGQKIQHNVLDEHYDVLNAARHAREACQVAIRQIDHKTPA